MFNRRGSNATTNAMDEDRPATGTQRMSLTRRLSGSISNALGAIRRRSSLSLKSSNDVISQGEDFINPINSLLPSQTKTVLFCWGRNSEGQLLVDKIESSSNPTISLENEILQPFRDVNLERRFPRIT